MPPLTKSDSLGDALSAAMSAVELGGEAFQQLSAAENSYVGQASGAPTQLHKDRLIGEGGYSLVWLVHDEGDASKKFALKQMHKEESYAHRARRFQQEEAKRRASGSREELRKAMHE